MAAYTDVAEIPGKVAALRAAYKKGVTRPLEWRRRQLRSLRRMLEENQDAICTALAEDLRKPFAEAAIGEVYEVLGQTSYMDKNLENFTKVEKIPTPLHQKPLSFEARRDPFGVVTVIAPWNFPIALLLSPLASMLAAGNVCVLKPSEISAASSRLLAEMIPKYFDPEEVTIITGGVPQTTALLAQKVDIILYTGGGQVAKIVMAAAAKNLTPVVLELGGKSPAYVDESANIQVAARRIAYAKNLNAGQICIAPDHILVHEKVRDSFLAHLKTEHERLYPGNEQDNADKGRIVNQRHFERLQGLLKNHGGQVVQGGKVVDAEKRYMEFTVITDPDPESMLMKEEIFGPILPVITVKSVDEAIGFCDSGPTPLAAYVFERDLAVREKWLRGVDSGGACVNDCLYQIINNGGGLSGKGESGMGTTRGRAGFETFSHRKVVAMQPANFDPLAKYPPYTFKGVPTVLKILLLGEFPAWVKLGSYGVAGAAVAGLALLVSKFVSVSVSVDFL